MLYYLISRQISSSFSREQTINLGKMISMHQHNTSIRWSDRLDLLADGLIGAWKENTGTSAENTLFDEICVVVQDNTVKEWIKRYCLIEKKDPWILLNIRFVMLPEFLNDWLSAQTRGLSPQERRPAEHPYARAVLPWRIYHILERESGNKDLQELIRYIGDNEKHAASRRYALAVRLANLYDDYLNARHYILRSWEDGKEYPGAPVWQGTLYRMLYEEDPDSYASMYTEALKSSADPQKSLENGFPHYRAVHIFDIPFIQYPALCMLKKISRILPVTFWTFNPGRDWLAESFSTSEVKRTLARQIREEHLRSWKNLEKNSPPEPLSDYFYDSPQERILGAFAPGGRALLSAQLNDEILGGVSFDDICPDERPPALDFAGVSCTIHSCSSPRRELEAIKEGLHHFFAENPDVPARDVQVLCADWNTYAPILSAVFPPEHSAEGYIPVAIAGNIQEASSIAASFKILMTFYRERFEAGRVLQLLELPAIRKKFNISETSMETIRDFISQANIRWGADDEQIAGELNTALPEKPYSFSWQRGFDRLILNMLYSGITDEEHIVQAGSLGSLLPCGDVEGGRAAVLAALWGFVNTLRTWSRRISETPRRTAAEWNQLFAEMLNDFYAPPQNAEKEFARLRKNIRSVFRSMAVADKFSGSVELDVVISALSSAIEDKSSDRYSNEDCVIFSPLAAASAVPRRLVWICGLKNGVFPRANRPAAFDLIWKHPGPFDVSLRDKDLFAFLKAVLCAGEQLVFSYVREDHDPEKKRIMPILLEEFLSLARQKPDKLSPSSLRFYYHPSHGYHPRYFSGTSELPPPYSTVNAGIAEIISKNIVLQKQLAAFELPETDPAVIDLLELAEYCALPQRFLAQNRLKLKSLFLKDISDDAPIEINFTKKIENSIYEEDPDSIDEDFLKVSAVEKGMAPDEKSAAAKITDLTNAASERFTGRFLKFKKDWAPFSCNLLQIDEAWTIFKEESIVSDESITIDLDGRSIELKFSYRRIELPMSAGGTHDFVMDFDFHTSVYSSTLIRNWVKHLAGHAMGKRFFTVILDKGKNGFPAFVPVDTQTAREQLEKILRAAMDPVVYDQFKAENVKLDTPLMEQELLDDINKYQIKTGEKR